MGGGWVQGIRWALVRDPKRFCPLGEGLGAVGAGGSLGECGVVRRGR